MNDVGQLEIEREAVPCDLCGVHDAETVYAPGVAQTLGIVRCRRCGLMYGSPRTRLVDHEDYEQWEPEGLLEGVREDPRHPYRWRLDKESLQIRDFRETRRLIDRLHPRPGRLVEVGSGLGFLLRSFKDDGWEVLGVDPWRELPAFTQAAHGIETIPTTLEAAELPDASADVMVMLHVIEHVPSPVEMLREFHRVLKPGGHLVIETPRYDTFMFRLLGRRERSLRCDGHIYFFTFDSLKKTYEQAGFREVETRAVGRSMTAERFLWNAGNVSRSDALRKLFAGASSRLRLDALKFTLNLRDMQRVVVEKPAA